MKKYFSSKWACKNWFQILMNPSDVFTNLFRAKSEIYCYETVISLLLPRFIHFQHQHTNLDTFWNLYSSIIFWQDLCRSSTCQPTFETLAPAEKLSTVSSPYMVFHEFSQFEQLKKKINFLMVQNSFFSQLASWKKNHDKNSWNLPERWGSKSFSSNTNFVIMAVGKFEGIFTTAAMKHTLNFATVERCMNFSAWK